MDDERLPDDSEDNAPAADDIGSLADAADAPTVAVPTVGAALRAATDQLATAAASGARIEASVLLGHVLGFSRAELLASVSDPLTEKQQHHFHRLVERRATGEPLQYIRGLAPFLDIELGVHPGVFIPRPETEQVVEKALELWNPDDGHWAVDVGTGSGAIAIGLAMGQPNGHILAIDQSTVALDAASHNADTLDVRARIAFMHGDLLRSMELAPDDIGIIVSNPPYVAHGDEIDAEVRHHEPAEAWAAGPTGLEIYERLIPQAAALLRPGRPLVLELGYGQDTAVAELLATDGRWDEPHIDPDFNDIPRVLAVRRARNS